MLHLDNISLKSAVRYTSITAGACAIILAGAFFLGRDKEVENGMGGNTYPAFQSVTEDVVADAVVAANVELVSFEGPVDTDALSYMSYRIKRGDMIGKIAEQFEVTQDSIISVNNIRNSRTIQPGEYLKIPTKPGILYTVKKNGETVESITKEKGVDSEKCRAANGITALTLELKEGQTIFIPDAKLSWSEIQEINGDLFKKPIRASWYRSSSFGWRSNPFTGSRSYHSGVDMACPTGTSVYAAMAGKVIETGYNATYGNYVILQHSSGYKTLYGHLSSIKAKRGSYVNLDSIIGKVGSTGMSTGPHLHFTVFKNGKLVNPAALWN